MIEKLLCIPCIFAALALALWFALCSYWYVCVMRGMCHGPRIAPVTLAAPEVKVPVEEVSNKVWDELTTKPLTVYFAANSDTMLTTDITAKLADIVAYMKANPTARIRVTGHTNVHKSQAYTDQLGLTRAEAAKAQLVALGVNSAQITTESKGQSQLAGSPKTAEGRYLNRRVVISVVK